MDMVVANYRLLRDHLNVAQVDLATGVSMGATQTRGASCIRRAAT